MSSLVHRLSNQHDALRRIAGAMEEELARRNGAGVQDLLSQFTRVLRAHLDLEDKHLYPRFAARGDDDTGRIAGTFAKNMAFVSAALKAFLDRYEGGELDLDDFAVNWPIVLRMLTERMENEEATLYPLANADPPGLD